MRYWSLIFALAGVLGVAAFLYAPLNPTWWLPGYQATNASSLAVLDELERGLNDLGASIGRETVGDDELNRARTWAEGQRTTLARLVDRQFLASRCRSIADRLAAVIAAIDQAQAVEPPRSRTEALEPAKAAVAAIRNDLTAAREATGGDRGVIDGPVSSSGRAIDHLFVLILGITGLTFIGTMMALVWFTWKYAARPEQRAVYTHGSLRVEILWTVIPAAILVFIAFYQLGAWADVKFPSRRPELPPAAEITARQFMWRVRYPGPDGKLGSADDLVRINDLHFVRGQPVLLNLKSEDVIHSFFLPQFRIKQDAMPGWTVPVWFDCDRAGRYELLCAELCGWGHYKMRADVVVHENQADFDEWMRRALAEQAQSQPDQPVSPPVAETSDQ